MSTEEQPKPESRLGRRTFLAATGAVGAGLIVGEPARANLTARGPAPATTAAASPSSIITPAALPTTLTVGQSIGGGNVTNNATDADRYDILDDLRASWVRLNWYPTHYHDGPVPSPHLVADAVVAALQRNKNIHAYFELNHDTGHPPRDHGTWKNIGIAFAEMFSPGSAFLRGEGITDRGIESWAAMNEPDRFQDPNVGIRPIEHRAVLKGLADGIHSVHPAARVYPGGYVSANRYHEYTAKGRLPVIADLLNNGTLAGIDLHTYHDKQSARIDDRYIRSTQHDFDAMKQACSITRNIELIVTEHNYKDGSVGQGYDNAWAQRYFLPHLFDQLGVVGNGGRDDRVTRFAMYWSLFREDESQPYLWGTNEPLSSISYRVTGSVYKRILTVVHDMKFIHTDPKDDGEYVLEGGNKKVWVFQNIHPTWAPGKYGPVYDVGNIPETASTLEVWNHTGMLQTFRLEEGQTAMEMDTPEGYTYLILAR